jgi:TPR repeat protein
MSIDGGDPARLQRANEGLARHRFGTQEHEQAYRELRAIAEMPGAAVAQWYLGAYHLQVIQRPGGQAEAARWLQQAADAGLPPAIERMADMALLGIGIPYSVSRAIAALRVLADLGHAPPAWQLAYLSDFLASDEGGLPAATLLLRACALGYPAAYYSLGLRIANGDGIERNADLACALLMRAADAGFHDAREAAAELVPDAGPDATSLHARLKANLAAAQPLLRTIGRQRTPAGELDPTVPQLEAHLIALGHPAFALDAQGRAFVTTAVAPRTMGQPAWRWTDGRPRVGVARDFASREECAWLINRVADSMLRPGENLRAHSTNTDSEFRQFSGHVRPLKLLETDVVMRTLQRRAGESLGWRLADMEPSSVIRYEAGHQYEPHVDYFTDEQIELNRIHRGDLGGQRIATFLVYLRAPERGGETDYPDIGLAVRGERGMAVVHYNVANGRPDPLSRHAGRPVAAGEKWLWRSTLREHPMYA